MEETLTYNQKFWIRCLVQEVGVTEEHLEGVRKTSHYDALEYINKQANQREFLRKLGNSKRNHNCIMSLYIPHCSPSLK